MPYVVAVVVIIGVIASLNLLLTYGVIRRLREHTRKLAKLPSLNLGGEVMLDAGAEPAGFDPVETIDGERVTANSLAGALVGFFTPACAPCREQASLFAQRAAAASPERVLAVVVGSDDPGNAKRQEFIERFRHVARVVAEPDRGPLQRAFGVQGYPAMCVLDDAGRIKAAASSVQRLSQTAVGTGDQARPGPAG